MPETPRATLTGAALLCTGFLVGSHPFVTSHPLLRGLEPGHAEAAPASAPAPAAPPAPAPIPARLAALREAELQEAARAAARTDAPPPSAPATVPFVPGSMHPRVEEMLVYLTTTQEGRRHVQTWLERRPRYAETFTRALAHNGLPAELEAVAFVESDLVPTAVSRVGASGLWQFMPETARAYGLKVEPGYDERRHFIRATNAATAYLRDLYDHFGTWELALAAYNCGFGRVQRVVEGLPGTPTDFWAMVESASGIPDATERYVARVLAVAFLLRSLPTFGFPALPSVQAPRETETVVVAPGTQVWQLARSAGMDEAALRALNPELIGEALPESESELTIEVPRDRAERARITLPLLAGNTSTLATDPWQGGTH